MSTIKINQNQHLCAVTLDYHTVLLPAAKGIKLVELLRDAVRVDKRYDTDRSYVLRGECEVDYQTVKRSQLRMPDGETPTGQLLIERGQT